MGMEVSTWSIALRNNAEYVVTEHRPAKLPENEGDVKSLVKKERNYAIPWEDIETFVDNFIYSESTRFLYPKYKNWKEMLSHRDEGFPEDTEIYDPKRKQKDKRAREFYDKQSKRRKTL